MVAAEKGHSQVVRLLVDAGAQVNLRDKVRHIIELLVCTFILLYLGSRQNSAIRTSLPAIRKTLLDRANLRLEELFQ